VEKVQFFTGLRKLLGYEPTAPIWKMIKTVWDTDYKAGIETTPERILELFPDLKKPTWREQWEKERRKEAMKKERGFL
jgi:hypothetical protein